VIDTLGGEELEAGQDSLASCFCKTKQWYTFKYLSKIYNKN